jgi:DNA-binding NtrC family response regulator
LNRGSVLVVDDDAVFRAALRRYLDHEGYEVVSVGEADAGLEHLGARPFDVVLTDLRMPGVDGIEFIRRIRSMDAGTICIVITGFGSAERSVEALDAGAFWFIDKNYERISSFGSLLEKALELRQLRSSNRQLQRQLETRYGLDNIVGESEALRRTLDVVRKVADTDATVLLLGESGCGKELMARAIHYNSRRSEKPFVAVNCGAIPEELLESELFGHVRGAFTGAVRDHVGRFPAADSGTLLLDEIGDMSANLQTKLLRVLQEREFQAVGSSRTETVDVRIVAATNQDLPALIYERRFREDLYFRLNVVPIEVPSLRERREDIPLLTDHFLRRLAREHPEIEGITEAALKRLVEYDWPGNVRELEGLIERMVVLRRRGWIDESDIPRPIGITLSATPGRVALPAEGLDFTEHVEDFATDLIRQALEATGWNKNRAAKLLGLKRTTLVEKIRAKGITPPA